jgi:hypothetical protein
MYETKTVASQIILILRESNPLFRSGGLQSMTLTSSSTLEEQLGKTKKKSEKIWRMKKKKR